MKAGVAINPHTNIDLLEDTINDIDLYESSFWRESSMLKSKKLKELITIKGASTIIEVDGGVTTKNAKQLVEAGADVLVAGSYIFKADNPTQTIADLKKLTMI
jgi:ribulose-phosphate 3-epimerase